MSFFQNKIYPSLPFILQNLSVSAFGYYWKKRRYGGIFEEELKKIRERETYSYRKWLEYQNVELRKILVHAFDYVPLYQKKYSEAGIKRSELERINLEDLNKIPILTKNELRQFGTTKLLSTRQKLKGTFFSSSGSTGTPTRILFSKEMHQKWSAAFEARIRNWAGLTRFNSKGMIGGRRIVPEGNSNGPFYRYNCAEKQIYFSAYHISPQTAENYATALRKYRPDYMTGYAVSNYLLARFFNAQNIEVPRLKAVITSSEKLTPEMRRLFADVYGCKTYDSYSGVEACGLISENEYGQLLVSPDVGIMEIIKEDGTQCKPGETGEVISTGLLNYDQPLIRYRIGDYVRVAEDQNTHCGRSMLIIDEIVGRTEDVITGPDGRKMVRFHGIFINLPNVLEGQIIQHTVNDYQIKVVCTKEITVDEEKSMITRMKSQLGPVNIIVNQVPEIPRTGNGKFKAVISHLPQQ